MKLEIGLASGNTIIVYANSIDEFKIRAQQLLGVKEGDVKTMRQFGARTEGVDIQIWDDLAIRCAAVEYVRIVPEGT